MGSATFGHPLPTYYPLPHQAPQTLVRATPVGAPVTGEETEARTSRVTCPQLHSTWDTRLVYLLMCRHVYESQGTTSQVLPSGALFSSLETGSPTGLEFTEEARKSGQKAPGDPPPQFCLPSARNTSMFYHAKLIFIYNKYIFLVVLVPECR